MTEFESKVVLILMIVMIAILCILYVKVNRAFLKEMKGEDIRERNDRYEEFKQMNLDHTDLMPLFYDREEVEWEEFKA